MSIVQKSQKSLEYDKILAELSKYAKTEQSKKLCLDLTPFVKPEDIKAQIILTREAKDVLKRYSISRNWENKMSIL